MSLDLAPGKQLESWLLGHWVLRMPSGPLLRDGEPVPLGSRAIDLLALLVQNQGEVVSTEALLAHAWAGRVVEEGNLYLHISTLRKLLGRDSIRSVYGRGYQLMLDAAPLTVGGASRVPAAATAATRGSAGVDIHRHGLSPPAPAHGSTGRESHRQSDPCALHIGSGGARNGYRRSQQG